MPYFIQDLLGVIVAFNRLVAFLNRPEVDMLDWQTEEKDITLARATFSWPIADTEGIEIDEVQKPFQLSDLDFSVPRGKFTLVCGPLGSGKTLFVREIPTGVFVLLGLILS